jgi:hypothetical protein
MAWVTVDKIGEDKTHEQNHLDVETIGLVTLYFIFQREV